MSPLHNDGEEYVPGQYNKEGGILEVDFRSLKKSADRTTIQSRQSSTHNATKRKREDEAEDMAAEGMDGAGAAADGPPEPKRRAYDNVSGKVSGRPWKAKFTRASAVAVKSRPVDWEAQMAAKKVKKELQSAAAAIRAEAKAVAAAEHKRRAEVQVRREASQKAALKVQPITNPRTLKKLTKKQAAEVWAVQGLGSAGTRPGAPAKKAKR